jgi:ABC-type spermidine/putrescine transport system permease subunit I
VRGAVREPDLIPGLLERASEAQFKFLKAGDCPIASAISFVLMAMISVGVMLYAKFLGTEDLA